MKRASEGIPQLTEHVMRTVVRHRPTAATDTCWIRIASHFAISCQKLRSCFAVYVFAAWLCRLPLTSICTNPPSSFSSSSQTCTRHGFRPRWHLAPTPLLSRPPLEAQTHLRSKVDGYRRPPHTRAVLTNFVPLFRRACTKFDMVDYIAK